jgi:hypothetical protein
LNGQHHFSDYKYPIDSGGWATAATAGATTWKHHDRDGNAGAMQVMTGKKLWVIERQMKSKHAADLPEGTGDHSSIHVFPLNRDGWSTSSASELYEYEGVVLEKGDML